MVETLLINYRILGSFCFKLMCEGNYSPPFAEIQWCVFFVAKFYRIHLISWYSFLYQKYSFLIMNFLIGFENNWIHEFYNLFSAPKETKIHCIKYIPFWCEKVVPNFRVYSLFLKKKDFNQFFYYLFFNLFPSHETPSLSKVLKCCICILFWSSHPLRRLLHLKLCIFNINF